jgi:hypothetical protein
MSIIYFTVKVRFSIEFKYHVEGLSKEINRHPFYPVWIYECYLESSYF